MTVTPPSTRRRITRAWASPSMSPASSNGVTGIATTVARALRRPAVTGSRLTDGLRWVLGRVLRRGRDQRGLVPQVVQGPHQQAVAAVQVSLWPGRGSPARIACLIASSTAAVRSGIVPADPVRSAPVARIRTSYVIYEPSGLSGQTCFCGRTSEVWRYGGSRSYDPAMAPRILRRRQRERKSSDEVHIPGQSAPAAADPAASLASGRDDPSVVTHRSPSGEDMELPCCGRPLSEVVGAHRITTDPAQVTCRG